MIEQKATNKPVSEFSPDWPQATIQTIMLVTLE